LAEQQKRLRVNVHGIDPKGPLWRWLVVEAARHDVPLGEYLSILILEHQELSAAERRRIVARHQARQQQ
jgi:hypothetical protein